MPCPHGVSSGYCRSCARMIRPTQLDRDLQHYANTPTTHVYERCDSCKRAIAHIRKQDATL